MEFGQGSEAVLETEKIYGGKNVVINDRQFDIGDFKKGQIVAVRKAFSVVGDVADGNTGDATIDDVSHDTRVKEGIYQIKCTAATAADVFSPSGEYLGEATFGVAFTSPQINFTITAGDTPCVEGDGFTVVATIDSELYNVLIPASFDGSEVPAAICAKDIELVAPGYAPIAFGEFQKAGVQEIMAALTTPVTITDAMLAKLDAVGCYLKDV